MRYDRYEYDGSYEVSYMDSNGTAYGDYCDVYEDYEEAKLAARAYQSKSQHFTGAKIADNHGRVLWFIGTWA